MWTKLLLWLYRDWIALSYSLLSKHCPQEKTHRLVEQTITKSIIIVSWGSLYLLTVSCSNIVFVMDKLWLAHKFSNTALLRFRSVRLPLPVIPLLVTLSLPIWVLKSFSRTLLSTTPSNSKKDQYTWLSFSTNDGQDLFPHLRVQGNSLLIHCGTLCADIELGGYKFTHPRSPRHFITKNIYLTFNQRCSIVWTLVAHGCELPMFFNQQSPAASQINFSHSVKHTK